MISRLRIACSFLWRKLSDPRWWVAGLLVVFMVTAYLQYQYDPWRQYQGGLQALQVADLAKVAKVTKALENSPAYMPHARYLAAAIAIREGDVKTALEGAIAAKEHPDLLIDANVLAGEAAYSLGAVGNAKLYWEEALRSDPNCVLAHRWMGVLYYDIGAMDAAMLHLTAVSRLDPSDHRADRLMGLMNRDYERPETAIPHYQESLRRAPRQRDADLLRLEMAECHIKLRDFPAALDALKQCVQSPKRDTLTARCLLNLGSLEEARSIARNLLGEHKDRLDVLQINAEISLADSQLEPAAELLLAATKVEPSNHGVRTQLAQVFGRLGKTEESKEQTDRATELQGKWQKFSDLQIDAINRPTDASLRYEIGSLANQLGKPELAMSWFKAALAIDPSLRTAAEALSEVMATQPNVTATP
jgi:tetratricopeptide (TPR) repeat protein